MEKCYLKDNVLKIKILPYFCIKIGDYFFPVFLWHPVASVWGGTMCPHLLDHQKHIKKPNFFNFLKDYNELGKVKKF